MSAAGEKTPVWLAVESIRDCSAQAEAGAETWLSDSERQRLARIRNASRRAEFLVARLALRRLLACAYGGAPEDWRLDAPEGAPPCVVSGPHSVPPKLALSHSGDWAVCAAAAFAVGLDVETARPGRDHMRLAPAVCSEAEQTRLTRLQPQDRTDAFLTMWVLKEAWLKARGEGIASGPLGEIETRPEQDAARANARVWGWPGARLALCAPLSARVDWIGLVPTELETTSAGMWRVGRE